VRLVEEDAMSDKEMEPIPEKFIAMLAREKVSLEDQLEKAVRDYPVLVLAYRIQEVVIGDLLDALATEDFRTSGFYEALNSDSASIDRLKAEFSVKLKKLKICVARAEDVDAGLDCFDAFING
jgi:hypothetical protein